MVNRAWEQQFSRDRSVVGRVVQTRRAPGGGDLNPFRRGWRLRQLVFDMARDLTREYVAEGSDRFRQAVLEGGAQALSLPRDTTLGDDAFVARFQPYRECASLEVARREGRRRLDAIFQSAVTRASRNAVIVTAAREGYALAEIARYLQVH